MTFDPTVEELEVFRGPRRSEEDAGALDASALTIEQATGILNDSTEHLAFRLDEGRASRQQGGPRS